MRSKQVLAALAVSFLVTLIGIMPSLVTTPSRTTVQAQDRYTIYLGIVPKNVDLHNLPAPQPYETPTPTPEPIIHADWMGRIDASRSNGNCGDAAILWCDGTFAAWLKNPADPSIFQRYDGMSVFTGGTLIDCPSGGTYTEIGSLVPYPCGTPVPTPVTTQVPPPTQEPPPVECGNDPYVTKVFALARTAYGPNPSDWDTDVEVLAKWSDWLTLVNVKGVSLRQPPLDYVTKVEWDNQVDPMTGQMTKVPIGLSEVSCVACKSGQGIFTDDLMDPDNPTKLWDAHGRCLGMKKPEPGSRKFTGSQKCTEVEPLTSDQVTVYVADPSCQWSVWPRFAACLSMVDVLSMADGQVNWQEDAFGIGGAQLKFNRDWTPPSCVAHLQMNGADVSSVKAGDTATIWLRDDTSPFRVR